MEKILFGLVIILSLNSFATGGFNCDGENEKIKFHFAATTGSMFGAPIVEAQGPLEYKKALLAQDIKQAKYDKTSVTNYWSESTGETKVRLYYDGGTDDFFGEVDATLIFRPIDKDSEKLIGTLQITKIVNTVYKESSKISHQLNVTCTAE